MCRYAIDLRRSAIKLRRVDDRPIPKSANEVRLFAKVRNEETRLPYFIEHYRNLGVDRFFFIDNASDDNTVGTALHWDRVHVFQTDEGFSNYPRWLNILFGRFGGDGWCMTADSDELLVLPTAGDQRVDWVIGDLEDSGETALISLLLDMYPEGPIDRCAPYHAGEDPVPFAPLFDLDFVEEEITRVNGQTARTYRSPRFSGGMRKRLFDLDLNLTKIALFKMGTGVWLGEGAHSIDGVRLSTGRAVTLHMKHLPGLTDRIISDTARGEHAGNSSFLRPVAQRLRDPSSLRFDYPGSHRFSGPRQLLDLGLLRPVG